MSLKDDLSAQVASIFRDQWSTRDGQVVPSNEDIKLGNDAVKLNATVLYADMAESTALVDTYEKHFAAEIYKAYLHCAAKVIRSEGGEISAYDGDRVMAIFLGETKNTSAVRAALKINWCRMNIVNPAIKGQYPKTAYEVKHTVGIDTCELWVARTGIRGSNDLVWVGRAANHAAKLCGLDSAYPTWITGEVYDTMHKSVKDSANGVTMWSERKWSAMNDRRIYRSTYTWALA
jgi:class 3 adenylate cyclase